ncbi:MAG: lytic transglycosylase domain-containing protein [Sphingobium sp.]|uniref:lytic transglycosylase domain-containing protein n=1 Tax=Sphingomonadales TaxID=204457 RepID=UPI00082B2FBB|nr:MULTISPECIES: lytic transglycosylase domain-containing protein [Sphingomonadaceae]MDF0489253.1 lytic transglycosylase domain-containing protein [Sphingomonas pollutisoli]MDF0544046.1 lytic transglycosylase domain-containing protein [Sphingobium arseniciresistens]MDX3899868.1 lytic transglycosylase domain-containing protein [Sphingobium sp.]
MLEGEIARCIRQASSGKLWLEKTLWGLRDQEGGWVGAEIENSNGSHDLGPLQVNSWWVPKLAAMTGRPASHVRWWLTHDACFNVNAARWIFLSSLAMTRDYWRAVGAYHSPTQWRQRRYAASVAVHLQRRFGRDAFFTRASVQVVRP